MRRGSRIAGLDVLRGLAIALVLARHAWPDLLPGAGLVGVVVFFTLSGWLITGLLQGELERTGRLDLGGFYRRRLRRLGPPLLLMLAGYTVVTLALDPLDERHRLGATLLTALTWTADLPFTHITDGAFHLWTLAVEEQFYLVWPLVLLLAHRARRTRTVVGGITVLALLLGWAVVAHLRSDPDLSYALPTTWAVCLAAGGLLRVTTPHWPALRRPARWGPAVIAALAALVVLGALPLRGHLPTYLVVGPLVAALTGVLLLAWESWEQATTPAARTAAGLGLISYDAYLWNYPVALWLRPVDPTGVLGLVLTLLLALGSWLVVERSRGRRRLATTRASQPGGRPWTTTP